MKRLFLVLGLTIGVLAASAALSPSPLFADPPGGGCAKAC